MPKDKPVTVNATFDKKTLENIKRLLKAKSKKSSSVECQHCSVHFTPKHKHQDLCSDRCAEIYNTRYRRGDQ